MQEEIDEAQRTFRTAFVIFSAASAYS